MFYQRYVIILRTVVHFPKFGLGEGRDWEVLTMTLAT